MDLQVSLHKIVFLLLIYGRTSGVRVFSKLIKRCPSLDTENVRAYIQITREKLDCQVKLQMYTKYERETSKCTKKLKKYWLN